MQKTGRICILVVDQEKVIIFRKKKSEFQIHFKWKF